LERYHRFFGDDLAIEYPTASEKPAHPDAVADDLWTRQVSIFLIGPDGRRPPFRMGRPVPTRPELKGQPRVQRVHPAEIDRLLSPVVGLFKSTATTRPAWAPRTRPDGPESWPT